MVKTFTGMFLDGIRPRSSDRHIGDRASRPRVPYNKKAAINYYQLVPSQGPVTARMKVHQGQTMHHSTVSTD